MTLSESLSVAVGASVLMPLGMGVNRAAVFKLAPREVPEAVGCAAGGIGGLGAFGRFAVFAALIALAAVASGSLAGAARAQSELTGGELYEEYCEVCHEADGSGDPGEVPPLANNPKVSDIAYLQRVIREGRSGALERLGETYDDEMDGFPELSDEEVAAIVAYVQGGFAVAATRGATSAPELQIPGDVVRGEQIFAGDEDLSNGGPSCFACHTAGRHGHLGGTGLGPDLTALRERFKGDVKLAAALRKPPSPVMRQVYVGQALSDEELADLRAFFTQVEPAEPRGTDWLIVLGLVGAAVLLGLNAVAFASIPKVSYSRMLRNSK